ncbi:hypothetical protein [Dactylosporangium matsuzakiense]|uniref:Uncharacterized protein n=1 Tax=Dactylosporangium matsuzakiense TaxID=53360 RepID=A0A9W6KLF6_9ACTN|nr:hypothetical protein [Dactylosporangium matsuzakiense]UWZ41625.1 hypothetical protein Dmats_28710 [Dactylosporangium matsuzakiense]GLL02300.1 hypothetical protein GCM10017581_040420 [Dactylosporangium matsuzakiense]
MRILLMVYGVYAAAAALLLLHVGGVVAVAGTCGTVAAACCFWTGRRTTIAVHAAMIPAQFVFSIPSDVPLVGLALSAAIVVAARPAFPRLRPRIRKLVVTAHVGLSVGWLGLATAMTVLAATALVTSDASLRPPVYRMMHVFDLVVVVPSVVLALLTGVVLALCTPWGLVRHWWVLTKFVLSLAIPAVAGFQHLWISALIERAAEAPGELGVRLLVCFVAYDVTLWTATALSVFKPGGRTPWAR